MYSNIMSLTVGLVGEDAARDPAVNKSGDTRWRREQAPSDASAEVKRYL